MKLSITSVILVAGIALGLSVSHIGPAIDKPNTVGEYLAQTQKLEEVGKYAEAKELLQEGIRRVPNPHSLWFEYERLVQRRLVPSPFRYNSPATITDLINLLTIIEQTMKLTKPSDIEFVGLSRNNGIELNIPANIFAPFVKALIPSFGQPSIIFSGGIDMEAIMLNRKPIGGERVKATFHGNRPFFPPLPIFEFEKSEIYSIVHITAYAERLPSEVINLVPRP